jgi:hypothetical protein
MDPYLLKILEDEEAKLAEIKRSVSTDLNAVFDVRSLSALEVSAKALESNEYAPRLFPFDVGWRVTDGVGNVIAGRSENARWFAKDMMRIVLSTRMACGADADPRIFVDLLSYWEHDYSKEVEEKWSIRRAWDEFLDARVLRDLEAAARALAAHEPACERLSSVMEWRFEDEGGCQITGRSENARGLAAELLRVCSEARGRFSPDRNPFVAFELLSYDGKAMTSKDDCRV